MRISHSRLECYTQCPKKYYYRYVEKWTSPEIPSPLWFGRCIDEALNCLLATKMREPSSDYLKMNAKDKFQEEMKKAYASDLKFYKKDFYEDLIGDRERTLIDKRFGVSNLDYTGIIEGYYKKRNQEKDVVKYCTWLSMVRFGELIIEQYEKDVMPQIHEVFTVQEQVNINIKNEDEIIGIIDFTASFVDDPDTVYVCDNKTSSRMYFDDSVETSSQLATYVEYKGHKRGCFIVALKKLYKKEPKIKIQTIKSGVAETTIKKTFDKYENLLDNIHNKRFDKDMSTGCRHFGQLCEYYNLCHYGKNEGLVKK